MLHFIDIGLFFCEVKLTQTFVFDFFEAIVVKQFLDDCVLEGFIGNVGRVEFCGSVVIKKAGYKESSRISRTRSDYGVDRIGAVVYKVINGNMSGF